MGSEPAANAFGLQVSVDPLGELLILCRVADEEWIEFDARANQRSHVLYEVIGDAATTEEDMRNLAFGLVDCVDADAGWTKMIYGFQSFDSTQINISENCGSYASMS